MVQLLNKLYFIYYYYIQLRTFVTENGKKVVTINNIKLAI